MPDDENYQINQHPWLVLTVITPSQAPDTDVMSLSLSIVQCGPPGLPRADPTQAVVAGGDLLVVAITILPLTDFQPFTGNIILTGFSGTTGVSV